MKIWHIALQGCLKKGGVDYGCCADTGGHIKYLIDLVTSLSLDQPELEQVIITRRFEDSRFPDHYHEVGELFSERVRICRIADSERGYLPKEKLWKHRDRFVENLERVLEDEGELPDMVHAHYADAGAVAAHLKKRYGVPFIFTAHSLGRVKEIESPETIGDSEDFEARVDAEELAIAKASLIIASSKDEAEKQLALYRNYSAEKIRIIAPGTSFVKVPDAPQRRAAIEGNLTNYLKDPSKPLVLAIARPMRRKNLRGLVEAFAGRLWLRENCNLLILAGCRTRLSDLPGEQEEELVDILRKVDDYGLQGRVALPKVHCEQDLESYYQLTADLGGVFVNPALHEPFGLTLLEATLAGLPCVSTRNGGASDIMREHRNGLLIDPHSTDEIGQAIEKVLKQPEVYRELSEAALNARENLDWIVHAKRYRLVTKEILESQVGVSAFTPLEGGLICCDIDNTLTGDVASLRALTSWLAGKPEHHFIVSTGRGFEDALSVLDQWKIPRPKVLVTSVGSEIYHMQADQSYQLDEVWSRSHCQSWDVEKVGELLARFSEVTLQKPALQRPRKLGYYLKGYSGDVLERIRETLAQNGQDSEVIFSHDLYLDILPSGVDKGHALGYLQDYLAIPRERTIAAGDSLNDRSMLTMAGMAIVVGNGAEELSILRPVKGILFAEQKFAAGLLEGLKMLESLGWKRIREAGWKGNMHV